jgi:hypothetical protein
MTIKAMPNVQVLQLQQQGIVWTSPATEPLDILAVVMYIAAAVDTRPATWLKYALMSGAHN